MKRRFAALMIGLTCFLAASVSSRSAEVSFSAGIEIGSPNDFYEPLTPYGQWVTVGSYGRCWHPVNVDPGWRPYCEGHWESTDCGWYWVSDEPWAWACYHYGSWVDDPSQGWCWIPGTEWAPAWVTWREAPDYVGWAPCGPGGAVLAPSLFVFVDIHHFHDPIRPNGVIVNNTTIINRTHVINDIRREDRDFDGRRSRVVINQGPKVDVIAKATGARFTARPVRDVVSQTPVPERIKRTGTINRPVLREQNVQGRRTNEQGQQRTTQESQREQQTSPTGREQQQRTYPNQRPDQARPEQRPPPSTSERREENQQRPEQVTPQRPLPPTGREQPRPSPAQPEEKPSVPQRSDQVRPEQHSTPTPHEVQPQRPSQATPERPLPPTGREQPHVSPTPERPTPAVPPERVQPQTGREVPKEQPSVKEAPHAAERPATPPAPERGRSQERKDDKKPDSQ